jgi:hypothetical protein
MTQHKLETAEVTVAVASSGQVSESFQIPGWATFVGVLFPAMDNGDVTLHVSLDDSTFHPVLDPSDGNDLIVCGSGDDPGWMDISDYVRFVPEKMYVRFGCAAQSSGAIDINVYFRG